MTRRKAVALAGALSGPMAAEAARTFVLGTRLGMIGTAALPAIVGAMFVLMNVLWTLGLLKVNGKAQPDAGDAVLVAFGIVAGGVSLLIAFGAFAAPYRIIVHRDGLVEFQRILGVACAVVSDIRTIERTTSAVYLEGSDPRELRIAWSGGAIHVPYFDDVDDLIAELVRRNRGILVCGKE